MLFSEWELEYPVVACSFLYNKCVTIFKQLSKGTPKILPWNKSLTAGLQDFFIGQPVCFSYNQVCWEPSTLPVGRGRGGRARRRPKKQCITDNFHSSSQPSARGRGWKEWAPCALPSGRNLQSLCTFQRNWIIVVYGRLGIPGEGDGRGSRNGTVWLGFLRTNRFAALRASGWACVWWRGPKRTPGYVLQCCSSLSYRSLGWIFQNILWQARWSSHYHL